MLCNVAPPYYLPDGQIELREYLNHLVPELPLPLFLYLRRILALLTYRPDWSVLVGPEEMLSYGVLASADGGVNGEANLFPRLYVKLYEAARAGNLPHVRELHSLVMCVSENL